MDTVSVLAQFAAAELSQYYDYLKALLKTYALLIAISYILPGLVASIRRTSNQGAVWVITLFLGWTYFGWVIALAMAFSGSSRKEREHLELMRKELRSIRWLLESALHARRSSSEKAKEKSKKKPG